MTADDRDGITVSLGVHLVILILLAIVAASPATSLDEAKKDLVMVDIDFGPIPVQSPDFGEPQSAPAGSPSAAVQPEPEQPAPPAATPVETPRRPTPTPPRPDPLPQPARSEAARPQRPSPPSRETRPNPTPTPRQQTTPTEGTGTSQGAASTSGTSAGSQAGSGGDAPAEVGFQFGNRSFDCPTPPFEGTVGSIQFVVTFAPNGRYVSARPRSRNAELERLARSVLPSCRAAALPPNAAQVNQSTTATFRFTAN